MSTAEAVMQALSAFDLKRQSEKEWRCNSPFRPTSNSHAFAVTFDDDEHGAYYDHVSGESGSLYELAKLLNITLPEQAADTKRVYSGLDDYASAHGVDAKVFTEAGWTETVYAGRPALHWKVNGVDRYRMLDGDADKPFLWGKGYKPAWYGLERAIRLANQFHRDALVLCNGEPSTVVAQHYNVPAFCQPGGEKSIRPELLRLLLNKWQGRVWIALDCDNTGRRAAADIFGQFEPGRASVLNLGLSEHGDLADVCSLYGEETFDRLQSLIASPPASQSVEESPDMVSHYSVAIEAVHRIERDVVGKGYPLVTPFECMHHLGGLAEVLTAGKVAMIIAPTSGGKTSFLETWADFWLMRGISGVMRGDEWTPQEYHYRRVQRYGGIDWNRIQKHELAKIEEANRIPPDQRCGVMFSDNEIHHYQEISMGIAEWKGTLYHYNAARKKRSIDESLDIMSREIEQHRREGQIMAFAIFDYIQLLKSARRPVDDNAVEFVFGLVKNWTEDNNIVSLVGSQATKAASRDGENNHMMSAHDALSVRIDKANLAITLNMVYEDDPDGSVNPDGTPVQVMTPRCVAEVKKNSGGSKGTINLIFDFARLQWLNTTTTRVSLIEE